MSGRYADGATTDLFTADELRLANAHADEYAGRRSLMPFERGMEIVERVADHRYLTVITESDRGSVTTAPGYRYDRYGTQLGDRSIYRSLTSPAYALATKPTPEPRA